MLLRDQQQQQQQRRSSGERSWSSISSSSSNTSQPSCSSPSSESRTPPPATPDSVYGFPSLRNYNSKTMSGQQQQSTAPTAARHRFSMRNMKSILDDACCEQEYICSNSSRVIFLAFFIFFYDMWLISGSLEVIGVVDLFS